MKILDITVASCHAVLVLPLPHFLISTCFFPPQCLFDMVPLGKRLIVFFPSPAGPAPPPGGRPGYFAIELLVSPFSLFALGRNGRTRKPPWPHLVLPTLMAPFYAGPAPFDNANKLRIELKVIL